VIVVVPNRPWTLRVRRARRDVKPPAPSATAPWRTPSLCTGCNRPVPPAIIRRSSRASCRRPVGLRPGPRRRRIPSRKVRPAMHPRPT